MPSKEFGRATYKAYRLFGLVHLVASGQTPNFNDVPSLEQLPFRIFPPLYGFFVTTQDIVLPTVHPFVVQLQTIYPANVPWIRVQDADGEHTIAIAEVVPPIDALAALAAEPEAADFCVFQWIGIQRHMIARCGDVVPTVYERVFGPATMKACEDYIADQAGK